MLDAASVDLAAQLRAQAEKLLPERERLSMAALVAEGESKERWAAFRDVDHVYQRLMRAADVLQCIKQAPFYPRPEHAPPRREDAVS